MLFLKGFFFFCFFFVFFFFFFFFSFARHLCDPHNCLNRVETLHIICKSKNIEFPTFCASCDAYQTTKKDTSFCVLVMFCIVWVFHDALSAIDNLPIDIPPKFSVKTCVNSISTLILTTNSSFLPSHNSTLCLFFSTFIYTKIYSPTQSPCSIQHNTALAICKLCCFL